MNWEQGISKFFITDDNFARNRDWEKIFDRLINLREEEKIPLGLLIQVDTLCHKIPRFMEKAKRAGVTRVFIGLENINPTNLLAAKKRQNKITEYRKMLLAWKALGHPDAGRLHPGLSRRHAGVDPPRHRGDQARAAARHPRVLLPHAAAGLGGPPEALARRRRDAPGPQPLRPRARLRAACEDEPERVGGDLPRGVGDSTTPRTTCARCCSRGFVTGPAADEPAEAAADLLDHDPDRAGAPDPGRHSPPEAPVRAPPRPDAAEPGPVLGRLRLGDGAQARVASRAISSPC